MPNCSPSPTSSSAAATKIRSPAGSKPSRASDAIATALAATWPFMSSAPRPHTWPSLSSPDQGSTDHSAASASTVSVWDMSRSRGPPPRPGMRATRFARSGTFAYSSQATPFSSRYSRSSSAARVSLPGGLTVSTWTSRWRRSTTSLIASSRARGGSGAGSGRGRPRGTARRARCRPRGTRRAGLLRARRSSPGTAAPSATRDPRAPRRPLPSRIHTSSSNSRSNAGPEQLLHVRLAVPTGRDDVPPARRDRTSRRARCSSGCGCQAVKPSRSPHTRASSRAAASWSGAKMNPRQELTTSNDASSYGSASASPRSNWISGALARATSSIPGAMSTPVTCAPAAAARMATPPVPVATSSQRSPGRGSRRATSWSCTGA